MLLTLYVVNTKGSFDWTFITCFSITMYMRYYFIYAGFPPVGMSVQIYTLSLLIMSVLPVIGRLFILYFYSIRLGGLHMGVYF